jgi:dTDP-4-amino-4,6-dideoxygalactose transaminase
MIPVTRPVIPDQKKLTALIEKVNHSSWLTNFGPLHTELTAKLEGWLGVQNLLLVSNGTLALNIAFRTLNIRQAAFTTPFSFIATTAALEWERIRHQFIDIDPRNLCLDPRQLPARPEGIDGIVGVHVYGNPAGAEALETYARTHGLPLVFDGAHAFGIRRGDRSALGFGDATTLSLHATKVFHTVEGGAIVFRRREDYEIAKRMINFGFDDAKDVVQLGINAKLNEYQCAVGLALFDDLEAILERRRAIEARYLRELEGLVTFPAWDDQATRNGAYFPIILRDEAELLAVTARLASAKVQTRRYFHPSLNTLYPGAAACPVSEDVSVRVLCLPIFYGLNDAEQTHVITELRRHFGKVAP